MKISFSRIFYFLLSFIFFDWFHFNRNVFETFFVLFLFDWSESWGENWRKVEKFFSANTQSEDGRLQLRWSHLSYYYSAPTYTPFLFFFFKKWSTDDVFVDDDNDDDDGDQDRESRTLSRKYVSRQFSSDSLISLRFYWLIKKQQHLFWRASKVFSSLVFSSFFSKLIWL